MQTSTAKLNTPAERRAYALQGHCLCESCDAIRRAELSPAELAKATLPAADISKLAAREA